MGLYQYAKISGIAFKLFFPEGTAPEATPVQWALGYSASECLYPGLIPERLQTLATYQTSSCSAINPISRFFRTGAALSRLGIEWFNTDEFPEFNNATTLYNGQLPKNQGSSTHIALNRPVTATGSDAQLARLEVTYYVTYKGTKGISSLVAP